MGGEDFELLKEAYLAPLLASGQFEEVSIYEISDGTETLRASSQESPITTNFKFSEFIQFEKKTVGVAKYNLSSDHSVAPALKAILPPLAALFAWRTLPWAHRLQCLQKLNDLKKKYAGFDWIGIYRRDEFKKDDLIVSAYLGEPTDHVRIPVQEGICGAAIRENRSLNIANVRADPRFIACSVRTQSEIVVPIQNSLGEAIAEIDIDSNTLDYFQPEKVAYVEACARDLSQILTT